MAKDVLEPYCDLEQSLPKTTIHRRNVFNGFTSPKKNNIAVIKPLNDVPIIIDDDDDEDVQVEENSCTIEIKHEENGFNGFQLAVLREVECNIDDEEKSKDDKPCIEVKRKRGRPKGYVMKKKEPTIPAPNTKLDPETEEGSDKKSFSLRLDFLGRYNKHKTKIRKEKLKDSSDDNSSPTPKRKRGRPLSIKKGLLSDENSLINLTKETGNSSDGDFSSSNKTSKVVQDIKDIRDSKENNYTNTSNTSSQTSEKIINVKPISLEPRRRMGRPKGPPKPPKIKGKRGRKPNPNKPIKIKREKKFRPIKTDGNESNTVVKSTSKRGRPKLYPDRPKKIKIPGRRAGRPPGPPKPFKPKGPRGRPRLIRINTSDRPHNSIAPAATTITKKLEHISGSDESLQENIENDMHENKIENSLKITKLNSTLPKKKRGRPLGWSPLGKTSKRLGRPPIKSMRGLKSRRGRGRKFIIERPFGPPKRGRGRPRKVISLEKTVEKDGNNSDSNDSVIYVKSNESSINNNDDEGDDDECSDISVTDKNWETIVEDSQELSSVSENDNTSNVDDISSS